MDFIREKEYKGQIIKEQIKNKYELSIITFNKNNGKWYLWIDGEKFATGKDRIDLEKHMNEIKKVKKGNNLNKRKTKG